MKIASFLARQKARITVDAYPDQPIKFARALKLAAEMVAAPEFDEGK